MFNGYIILAEGDSNYFKRNTKQITMAQQTAVEWLVKELNLEGYDYTVEQAKQIEKKQIVVSFYEGMKTNTFDPNMGRGVMYYNETYNK